MSSLSVFLPPFASDYSGVCSALFDFDSLIAINDAHCCTGTYVHFDEPRWALRQRPTLCAMLRDIDAVFGNDEKVIAQVTEAAKQLNPDFAAVLGSPVPAIIGMDIEGIAAEIEMRWGKPVLGFSTTGFAYYDKGVSMALHALVRRFTVKPKQPAQGFVNLLGITPLDFGTSDIVSPLCSFLEAHNLSAGSRFCMGIDLQQVCRAGEAAASLVVSASGLQAAKYLNARFGIPFLAGYPMGKRHSENLMMRLSSAINRKPLERKDAPQTAGQPAVLILWDQVLAVSLREALRLSGIRTPICVGSFFAMDSDLCESGDIHIQSEAHLASLLDSGQYCGVIGDPLLKRLPAMQHISLYPIVHPAVSSRLHWEETPAFDALADGPILDFIGA